MAISQEERRMNRKMVVGAVLVALAVVMTAGTLVASNMGFKLNYSLDGPGVVAKTGNNTLGLPDNRQSGVNSAKNLMDDIGFASVTQVQRFLAASDAYLSYTGRSPQNNANNFALTAGEAYVVKMKTSTNYIVVGSDDPAISYTLSGPGVVAKTGNNFYAFNYHQTAASAKQLMDDVGFQSVTQVQRFLRASDAFLSYTGRSPQNNANNFSLTPGEGYVVKMKTTAVYSPSHY
jgi:hypothetical protein